MKTDQRIEWLPTQAYLLATTRADGHISGALDNGNCFMYAAGVGWIEFMPGDGVEGQPLVGATMAATPVGSPIPRRTRIEFGSQNHLVPLAGTAGQIAKLDEFGQTQVADRDADGSVAMPVDFSDGALHNVSGRVIPSGSLGTNGFVRMTITARVITNAGRTVTFGIESLGLESLNLTSSANYHALKFEVLYVNQDSETTQSLTISLEQALFVHGSLASAVVDKQLQTYVVNSYDQADDWVLEVSVFASAAVTGLASIDTCLLEYGYIP